MCGICGQFNYAENRPVSADVIRRMADSIIHRGPDDEGFFIEGPVGLGFRRLSIIDLSGGHQPMSDQEKTVWVVFNGEIYNYLELRSELESKGYHFKTKSDTEVIVHGYKEWGTNVFIHLNGMFGIGIWDVKRRRLVLSRDAMGIKLIYYKIEGGTVSFGSEIRPLRVADPSPARIDPAALHLFLRFRYTPPPRTFFLGVRKLAPGSMLVFENGSYREERWYNYTPEPFEEQKPDEDAVRELADLYVAAVRRHLLSDVPVGILLSGGLDSGLLLALMNKEGGQWPTYTVGYGGSFRDDELVEAAETASLLGAKHIPVHLNQEDYGKSLTRIVRFLEEPVTSSSIVPMYFVCERARQDVKVVLIGQGPDELFGGYARHLGVFYGGTWRHLPGPVRSIAKYMVERLPRNETLKRGVRSLAVEDRLGRYQQVFALGSDDMIDGLFKDGALPDRKDRELVEYWKSLVPQMEHLDELGGFQLLEIRSSLPEELLMFADKLSMAHGLEARVPYLDRTVVEHAQRLGSHAMIRSRVGKWIHRQVCQKYLPPTILARKKRGFAVNVVDGWFSNSLKGELADSLLNEHSLMYEILEPASVRKLLDEHRAGRHNHYKMLFSLVMVEQWLRSVRDPAETGAGVH